MTVADVYKQSEPKQPIGVGGKLKHYGVEYLICRPSHRVELLLMNTSGIRWCDAVPVKDITSISRVEADALTAKQLYDFTLPSGITLEEHYSDTPKPKIGVGTRLRHANDGSEVLIVRTEYSEVAAIRYNGESWGFRKPAKDWRNLTMDEAASILGSWNLEKFTII